MSFPVRLHQCYIIPSRAKDTAPDILHTGGRYAQRGPFLPYLALISLNPKRGMKRKSRPFEISPPCIKSTYKNAQGHHTWGPLRRGREKKSKPAPPKRRMPVSGHTKKTALKTMKRTPTTIPATIVFLLLPGPCPKGKERQNPKLLITVISYDLSGRPNSR